MFRFLLSVGLILGASAQSNAQTIGSLVVAHSGQTAPGTMGATFLFLFPPAINASGTIVFRAQLDFTFGGDAGIWRWREGVVDLLIRESDPRFPAGVQSLGDPNVDDMGRVTFTTRDAAANKNGLWFLTAPDPPGMQDLKLLAEEGAPAPGSPFTFDLFGFVGNTRPVMLNRNGLVAQQSTVTDPLRQGLWLWDNGMFKAKRTTGDPVSGGRLLGATTSVPALSNSGSAAYVATVGTVAPTDLFAIVVQDGKNVTVVAHTGDPAPGISNSTQSGFSTLGITSNASGGVAYRSIYSAGAGPQTALFASQSAGIPTAVLRADIDGITPAFREMLLLDSGSLVFLATVNGGGGSSGIYATKGNGVQLLIEEGDTAPGPFIDAAFDQFDKIGASRNGQIAFESPLDGFGVNPADNRGIWVTTLAGPPAFVARKGDTAMLSTGPVTLTELSLNPGNGRAPNGSDGNRQFLSERGEVTWLGEFAGNGDVIMVTGVATPPPLPSTLVGLEVVQVIQDWENSVSLVANKTTFVRAHIQGTAGANIQPELNVFRGAALVAGSPFRSVINAGSVPVERNSDAVRANPSRSAIFRIPPAEATGNLRFVISNDSGLLCTESAPPIANDCEVNATFLPVATPTAKFVSLNWRRPGGPLKSVGLLGARMLASRLKSAFPISKLEWSHVTSQYGVNTGGAQILAIPPKDSDFGKALALLQTFRIADNCSQNTGCEDLYYGMIKGDQGWENGGIAYLNGRVGLGSVADVPTAIGRHTHSHEFGHMLGLPHAVDSRLGTVTVNAVELKQGQCNSRAKLPTPDFPYFSPINGKERPTLGPQNEGVDKKIFGLDSLQSQVVNPRRFFAMMSYCEAQSIHFWPSKNSYENLLTAINGTFRTPPNRFDKRLGTGDYLLARGTFDFETNMLSLLPTAHVFGVAEPDAPMPGGFTLRLKNSGLATLAEVQFSLPEAASLNADPTTVSFVVPVPNDPDFALMEIELGGQILASSLASPTPPTVAVLMPAAGSTESDDAVMLAWSGQDGDGDALSYMVQFSPDAGATWRTLLVDYAATTFEIDRASLPATTTGLLRVVANDGFHSTIALSPGSFSVTDNDPILDILAPQSNDLFVSPQRILFTATANDTEDGILEGTSVAWDSDLDGPLGTGDDLLIDVGGLTPGVHSVTATATDSASNTATNSIVVRVRADGALVLAQMAVEWTPDGQTEAIVGETFSVPLEVVNSGPNIATNVMLSIASTNGVGPISLSPESGWQCSGAACQTGALGVGESASFEVTASGPQSGLLSLTATVSAAETDAHTFDNEAELIVVIERDPALLFDNGFE